MRFWYHKPHWWQWRKKRWYRNLLTTNEKITKLNIELGLEKDDE